MTGQNVRLFWLKMILPVMCLSILAGWIVSEMQYRNHGVYGLRELAHFTPKISALIHELQRERGTSAGFLGEEEGAGFTERLIERRSATDKALHQFEQDLERLGALHRDAGFRARLELVRQYHGELDAHRALISARSLPLADATALYTAYIDSLLTLIGHMASMASSAEMTRLISALQAYLEYKERAGLERAMGSNGFGAGAFNPQVYQRFTELIVAQEAYLDLFKTLAPPKLWTHHRQIVGGSAVAEVDRLRALGTASVQGQPGALAGISGPSWFDTITVKIDLMWQVEQHISESIERSAEQIYEGASTVFWGAVIGVAVLLIFVAWLGTQLAHGISRSADAVPAVEADLAQEGGEPRRRRWRTKAKGAAAEEVTPERPPQDRPAHERLH